jgi:glycosyltransferase involved in cell wall biosynthesis/SAM-dependent methyltransferase
MIDRSILFVGPLPPPVHGFSEINRRMLARLQSSSAVEVFDVSPRGGGLVHLLRLFFKFFGAAVRGRGGALYLPLSGGLRQFVDAFFAGVALLCGMRVFVHHHSFVYLDHQPFYARIVLRLLRNSVHVVLCERMGDLLNALYDIPKDKLRVISNAAFLNETLKYDGVSLRDGKLVLGFLSNITAAKGCFDYIDLVKAAVAQDLDVEGVMAGPVHAEIRQAFADAVGSTGCIRHIGPVYGEVKSHFLSQIDVLLFPTRYENEAEPVTIWEAMEAGVPVISLARGCISSMVDSEVGWVIEEPSRFVEEGLEKIRYLLGNDSALVAMKVAARAEFEKAKQHYTNNLDALLLEILGVGKMGQYLASRYLCPQPTALYGDNFSLQTIEKWYAEEESGYANLGYVDSETAYYPYHLFNELFGWSKIDKGLGDVLSFGGAFAAEFERVARNVRSIAVIEPAKKFWRDEAYGLKLNYVVPNIDGKLDFPDQSFDTITVFGVLHHIPNVSYVFSELARVLRPGGNILIREPIISMGDWSATRPGLTKNERGIPLHLFGMLATQNKLGLVSKVLVGFPPIQKMCAVLHLDYWQSTMILKLDLLLCKMFLPNYKYHRVSFLDRFSPSNVFLVFRKEY